LCAAPQVLAYSVATGKATATYTLDVSIAAFGA
jgi:hypothetical protein